MTDDREGPATVELLEELRRMEKEQALVYRALAAQAEAGTPELAQRFHDLHADEQHHLSRLTARVLELGERPAELPPVRVAATPASEWEATIRTREAAEIARYQHALSTSLDPATHALLEAILDVEERHASELGGKWTVA